MYYPSIEKKLKLCPLISVQEESKILCDWNQSVMLLPAPLKMMNATSCPLS